MTVLYLAAWAALACTWIAAYRGLGLWKHIPVAQRWFAIFLLGSGILGVAMGITAFLKVQNWALASAWSAWIALTIGPALAERLKGRDREIARGLFILWLACWIGTRLGLGMNAWEGYMHPVLCGLILGVGMAAFDEIIKEEVPFWKNGTAILVVASILMAACDAVAWGSMRFYSAASKETFITIWTGRNLAMVPVSALYIRVFQVPA